DLMLDHIFMLATIGATAAFLLSSGIFLTKIMFYLFHNVHIEFSNIMGIFLAYTPNDIFSRYLVTLCFPKVIEIFVKQLSFFNMLPQFDLAAAANKPKYYINIEICMYFSSFLRIFNMPYDVLFDMLIMQYPHN
ncbi:hypothetical protein ACJX0J_016501, partial [Zea mays]